MSPEEFDDVTDFDDLYKYELIHGVVIVSPIPPAAERDPNDYLGHLLRYYRDHLPEAAAMDATLPEETIYLPNSRRRIARAVWTGLGRLPEIYVDVPTIAIEFVSRRHRDRGRDFVEKRRDYLALGVVEYWIIDLFRRQMTVSHRSPGESVEQVVAADGIDQTPLLPGFELPVARLLAHADAWTRTSSRKRRT